MMMKYVKLTSAVNDQTIVVNVGKVQAITVGADLVTMIVVANGHPPAFLYPLSTDKEEQA